MLTADSAAAGIVLGALCAYTVFGGADFGSGVWVLLARGPAAALERSALYRAMGPVWETNHIWLILAVVALFTAFPSAFAVLFTALLVPLTAALVGITFRGAAFAFHHYGEGASFRLPATNAVFAAASLLTPLALGTCLGAVAAGRVLTAPNGVVSSGLTVWFAPFPLLCGVLALNMCATLAACYMTTRTAGDLREYFRRRALASALLLGVISTAVPLVGRATGSFFVGRLSAGPLLLMLAAAGLGLTTLAVLQTRHYRFAPPAAAATCCAVLLGWGAAQYPYIVPPDLTIAGAAAPISTLTAFLIAMGVGLVLLGPALLLLLRILATGRTDVEVN